MPSAVRPSSPTAFWDESALVVEFYPHTARRAVRALAYLSLMPLGYAIGAHNMSAGAAPPILLLALMMLPVFAVGTWKPRYNRASIALCLLGSLFAGLLAAALWQTLGAWHDHAPNPLLFVGAAALGLWPARIGWLAAYHEACRGSRKKC